MQERLWTIKDLAEFAQVSRTTVYTWIRQGRLRTVKPGGGRHRITQSEVDRLFELSAARTRIPQHGSGL